MFEDIRKYRIERKSNVDIAREKITNNLTEKLVETFGLNDLYHLGCISTLHMLANQYDSKHPYDKEYLIEYLKQYTKQIETSKDIESLANECVKELEEN